MSWEALRLITEILEKRSVPTQERWGELLDSIQECLDELLDLTEFNTREASRMQNRLRGLYEEASRFVPYRRRARGERPADWVKTVLAQARIYFWLAAAEKGVALGTDEDVRRFLRDTLRKPVLTDSETAAYRGLLVNTVEDTKQVTRGDVARAASDCRRVLERARVQAAYWQPARRRR